MNECNSIEIDKTNLTDQTKYRLNKITKIENYFIKGKSQRKSCFKKLSKYLTNFDYIEKVLIVLCATSARVSIIFFYKYCWGSCRNSKCKFYSNFFFNHRNNKKFTKHNKKQKKSIAKFLCWLKVNSIAMKL